jgi:hypothetical protein
MDRYAQETAMQQGIDIKAQTSPDQAPGNDPVPMEIPQPEPTPSPDPIPHQTPATGVARLLMMRARQRRRHSRSL